MTKMKFSSEKFELSDTSRYSDSFLMDGGGKSRGCYVTPLKALGIVLAAAAVATAVGLLVYYKHPDYGKGSADAVTDINTVTSGRCRCLR